MLNNILDGEVQKQPLENIGVPINCLHHFANYCYDAEETRHFYEDLLGLRLVHSLRVENLPTSGIHQPYLHLFFEMEDKNCLAFFDLLDSPPHPGMTAEKPWTDHIALHVRDMDALLQAKSRLETANVNVVGPIDHEFVKSIYFKDPNGVNLELTINTADQGYLEHERDTAHVNLKKWNEEKRKAQQALKGVSYE